MTYRTSLLAVVCCFSSFMLFGQSSYKDMMHDPHYNFYEVVDSAEAYFETHSTGKGSGYIGYLRWKHENEAKFYPSGERQHIDPYFVSKSYSSLLNSGDIKSKTSFPNGWVDLGPYRADNITSHYSAGIGRVESFYVDPNDSTRLYLGSRSGGFWRSFDEGQSWENTTDFLLASGVNAIAVNPNNPDSILINIRNAQNGMSHGIYRSVDAGATWTMTDFNAVNLGKGGLGSYFQVLGIHYHPRVKGLVVVTASDGIYRSTSDLSNWSKDRNGWILDFEFHPTNDRGYYYYNHWEKETLYRTSNNGFTFDTTHLPNNTAVVHMATTPQNPNALYLAKRNGIWKSIDDGASFDFITNPQENCDGFSVSPLDSNIWLYGAVDLEVSTDAGQFFEQTTFWSKPRSDSYIHADIRTMEAIGKNFYVGTDGYFCKSTDNGVTWQKLNVGTGIRENYRVGLGQSDWRLSMSGSQDNGTSILNAVEWVEWNGGDGMEAVIHPLNADWMMGSWQYGRRQRTLDGGLTRLEVGNPEHGSGNADWIAPLLVNPLDHMKIYHFSNKVFSSDSFGKNWRQLSAPNINKIKLAAMAYNDSNKLVIVRNGIIRLSTDAGYNFTDISNPDKSSAITYIAFDPNNDERLFITYGNYEIDYKKIYQSDDLGKTWTNITYNLSNMPLRCVVVDHSAQSYIYVGAEIGVYYKALGDTSWTIYNENLANVTVRDLKIHWGSNTIKAATWGRGLWENTLVGRNDYPSIVTTRITDAPSESMPVVGTEQYVKAHISYDGSMSEVHLNYSVDDISLSQQMTMNLKHDSLWQSEFALPKADVGSNVYFQIVAIGEAQDTSISYRFMYSVRELQYCEGGGRPPFQNNHIVRVELKELDHSSGDDDYSLYRDEVVTLKQDSTYSLKVTLDDHNQDVVGAWIDFDLDATFNADELITFGNFNASHTATATFTVPGDARSQDSARLRIRAMTGGGTPDPCGLIAGEVEDYVVELIARGVSIKPIADNYFSIYPNPSRQFFRIDLKSIKSGHLSLYNTLGEVILDKTLKSGNNHINHELPSGIYIAVVDINGISYTKRLIVQ